MSQALKAQLNLNQNLKMAIWLHQSVKLLALSQMELKDTVEQELLSNPLLENLEENLEQPQEDVQQLKFKSPSSALSGGDFYEQLAESPYQSRKTESTEQKASAESLIPETQTLADYLTWQTQVSALTNEDKCFVLLLISHLDEKGYLRVSLEELVEKESLTIDGLERALFALQTLDPPGIGARDVRECLLIQTRSLKNQKEKVSFIIKNHLHNLERQNYSAIARNMKIKNKEAKDLCQIIMSFNPTPSKNFSSGPVNYITPDIYIYKEENQYKVLLYQSSFPMLKISSHYRKNLRGTGKHKKDLTKYFQEKLNSGQHFIRSLKQRKFIIAKVVDSIIKHQKDFFETGPPGLKYVVLKDVASDIGVHPSTVSRAVANKYVHTPRGVFPLKYFFRASKMDFKGQTLSAEPVKAQIREWISKEDPFCPLTDRVLREKIQSHFQVTMSRRVVSKYRQDLGILPARKRKKEPVVAS